MTFTEKDYPLLSFMMDVAVEISGEKVGYCNQMSGGRVKLYPFTKVPDASIKHK